MLTINVENNQVIKIGDNVTLKIIDIDNEQRSVQVRLCSEDVCHDFMAAKNTLMQLVPRVAFAVLTTVEGSTLKATLGFDAPRDIKIERTWEHRNEQA